MLKNKLTPLEQEIYFALTNKENRLFTFEMINQFGFAGHGTLKGILSDMVRKGWLTRLKKGMYYLNESGRQGIDDLFRVATQVYSGYLAFSSALYVYGAVSERPYTVYVATRRLSKSRIIGEMELRAVAIGRRAGGMVRYGDYQVSSKPKSLYDCFYLPEYAGGYSRILESVHGLKMNAEEWDEFIGYANRFEREGSKRKIGYMLEVSNKAVRCVPRRIIDSLRGEGSPVKLGRGAKGRYIREWGVVDYLGEQYLLGWSK